MFIRRLHCKLHPASDSSYPNLFVTWRFVPGGYVPRVKVRIMF